MHVKKMQDLSCELIDTKPQYFDFSKGYIERWDVPMDLSEEECDNEEFMLMMNFIYPLGDRFEVPDDFRDKLICTTIVQIDDEHYLALTGGGMDMTWEICASFINLGYYPPAHFCELPQMCGKGENKSDREIIDCCNESLDVAISWLKQTRAHNELCFPATCSKKTGAAPQKTACRGELK